MLVVMLKTNAEFDRCEQEKEAPGTYGEHLFLHAGSGSTKMNFLEPINSLMSDQEESESDDDVPYFSDIEAMVNLRCL